MGTQNKTLARNICWNTFGSLFYLFCQWLLSVLVVRISGSFENAGILSLAMSISTFFSVITLFNVRNYQVSDSKELYTSSDYIIHRLATCGVSLVFCIVFVLVNPYDLITSLSVIAFMLVKLVEGFADVLHGIAQKKWRLDIAGKSFVLRGVLLFVSFFVSMLLTQNLALSIFAIALTTFLALVFFDFRAVKKINSFKVQLNIRSTVSLTKVCLPMVAYGIFINAIVPLARYVLEINHGKQALGYYASVSTVSVLVQAFVTFVFTPLIGVFEDAYSKGDKKSVLRLLLKLTALLIAITALAIIAALVLGEFAMVLMFGEEIRSYTYLLYPTIIASCLTAFVWLLGMLLVVMRDSKTLLLGAFLGFLLGLVLAFVLIPDTVYIGTNVSIIAALTLISLLYFIKFFNYFFSKNVEKAR